MYHDLDFSILPKILSNSPCIVDVGANNGQSIRSIKHGIPDATIHSFEPNPVFFESLEELKLSCKNVEIYKYGLGNTRAYMTFYTPVINGYRYLEETTMRLESLNEPWVVERFQTRGGNPTFEEFTAEIKIGDDFQFQPDLIKIDVEGVESEVVQGFIETIEKNSPVLLIENGDWTRLHPIIQSLGYKAMMPDEHYETLIPFKGVRTNTFYIK